MLLHFVLLYSTFHTLTTDSGSTFIIIGFTIWADFNSEMQSLNHTIKTHPIVYTCTFLASSIMLYYGCWFLLLRTQNSTWYCNNYRSTIYHLLSILFLLSSRSQVFSSLLNLFGISVPFPLCLSMSPALKAHYVALLGYVAPILVLLPLIVYVIG